jgi:mono/diheme cytochrome c family protein
MISTRIIVGLLATVVAVTILLWMGITEPARMEEAEAAFAARSIENGAELFNDLCSGCHGLQGQGIAGVGPRINHQDFFKNRVEELGYTGTLEAYVSLTIASGRPVKSDQGWPNNMPTWSQAYGGPLRDDQIKDLTAFIMNWESTAPAGEQQPVRVESDDPVERGAGFFVVLGCIGCHALEGVSEAAVGPNLTNVYAEQGPDFIRDSILDPNAVISPGFAPGVMPANFGERTSGQDIDDLIAYLQSFSD